MNKDIVVSLTDARVRGAWVYRSSSDANNYFSNNECVWLLSSCSSIGFMYQATLYNDEYVYLETLILHAMYNAIKELEC